MESIETKSKADSSSAGGVPSDGIGVSMTTNIVTPTPVPTSQMIWANALGHL